MKRKSKSLKKKKSLKNLNKLKGGDLKPGLIIDPQVRKDLIEKMIISGLHQKVVNMKLNQIYTNSVSEIQKKVPKNKYLYDLIYQDSETLEEVKLRLEKPDLIYAHGVNNPETVTAGLKGLHIYLVFDSKSLTSQVVGLVVRT